MEIADAVAAAGFSSMIVLDVAAVGAAGGIPTLPLSRDIKRRYPEMLLATGGGVRHQADLKAAAACGVDRVLVASGLHDGRLLGPDADLEI